MKGVSESWLTEKGLVLQKDGTYRRPTPMLDKALKQSPTPLFKALGETIDSKAGKESTKKAKSVTGANLTSLDKFDFKSIEIQYEFDVLPCPAPRMTQRDKWYRDPNHPDKTKRQRPCVTRYNDFKERIQELTRISGYELTPVLNILFVIPMPISWSKNKQFQMNSTPHMSRPDIDNLCKAVSDCLLTEDSFIWNLQAIKIWGYKEKIIILKS